MLAWIFYFCSLLRTKKNFCFFFVSQGSWQRDPSRSKTTQNNAEQRRTTQNNAEQRRENNAEHKPEETQNHKR